jgi:hypothetical protein
MRVREVLLLILIIAVGVVFTHIHTGKWDFDWEEGFFFDTEEFTYTENDVISLPFPPELQVINRNGRIEVQGTSEDGIRIQLEKRIRRRKEETAREIAEALHLVIEQDEHIITVSTNREDLQRRNFQTDFTLFVPENMDIRIKNRYGRVQVSNVGETDIINRNGEVVAWDISGSLIIENSYEDVSVENVMFDCEVGSRQSNISLVGVKGTTLVVHRYGRVELNGLEKDVIIDGPHIQVYGRNLVGPVDVDSSYERIVFEDVGDVRIRGDNSPVSITGGRGSVDIQNRYARVDLENIRGDVEVTGRDTGLWARALTGDKVTVNTSYRDVELEDFTGEALVVLSNAALTLRPDSLAHPLEVRGEYCDITLFWPTGASSSLEAQTKNGDIHWGLTDEPAVNVTNGHSILKAFLNDQPPLILLSTTYADIHIKQQD